MTDVEPDQERQGPEHGGRTAWVGAQIATAQVAGERALAWGVDRVRGVECGARGVRAGAPGGRRAPRGRPGVQALLLAPPARPPRRRGPELLAALGRGRPRRRCPEHRHGSGGGPVGLGGDRLELEQPLVLPRGRPRLHGVLLARRRPRPAPRARARVGRPVRTRPQAVRRDDPVQRPRDRPDARLRGHGLAAQRVRALGPRRHPLDARRLRRRRTLGHVAAAARRGRAAPSAAAGRGARRARDGGDPRLRRPLPRPAARTVVRALRLARGGDGDPALALRHGPAHHRGGVPQRDRLAARHAKPAAPTGGGGPSTTSSGSSPSTRRARSPTRSSPRARPACSAPRRRPPASRTSATPSRARTTRS